MRSFMGGVSTDVKNLEDEFQDIQKSLGNVPTTTSATSPRGDAKAASTKTLEPGDFLPSLFHYITLHS
jgi:hypothetical protein